MQLISKFNKGTRFLLCDIDILLCDIDIWVIPLKDKKGATATNFQKILTESNRKPNKIWVEKGSKFYNRPMKSWLEKKSIETYSTYNKGKFFVAGSFIRTLKSEIYKYMTAIPKKVYIDQLYDIINKHSNTYHRT